jgi:hypothetical protein
VGIKGVGKSVGKQAYEKAKGILAALMSTALMSINIISIDK